ncbi:MAG: pilus assembly protein PilM [Pirellulales bacterium]|nr:pilus assembly protein PilM [Pirellulales bacterium]
MPRYLAVEWESRQARFLVAQASGGRVQIEACGSVTTDAPEAGVRGPHPELGQRLAEALDERRVPRSLRRRALVAVSRAQVDLRQLTLPPASDAELPDLVRLQAVRELSAASDSARVDFYPLSTDPSEPRAVLATAFSAESQQAAQLVWNPAGLVPDRLLLRPFAAASLFLRRGLGTDKVCLLVDVLCDEADMTVIQNGRVVVSRCLRLPAEDDDPVPLLAEIRRTILAVANQGAAQTVDAVYVFGDTAEQQDLIDRLRDNLEQPVECCDPFDECELESHAFADRDERRGPYAALVGTVFDAAERTSAGIDFLHPRRAPKPPSRRRRVALVGALVGFAALFVGVNIWSRFDELNDQIAMAAKQSKELDKAVKRAAEVEATVAAIEAWTAGDVTWLDELNDLSNRFPKARDAVMLRLTMSRAPAGGGTMDIEGLVRHPQIIERMETSLRDEFHEVRSKRVQESVQDKAYTWQFESSLSVARRDRDEFLAAARPATAPPAAEVTTARREEP